MENESKNQAENMNNGNEKLLLSDVINQSELLLFFCEHIKNNRWVLDFDNKTIVDEFIKKQ